MTKDQKLLLESCPESMVIVREGKPVTWNSQACRMLDWTSQKAGVEDVWSLGEGLFVLEGDERGLFETKLEKLFQGSPAKMRCQVRVRPVRCSTASGRVCRLAMSLTSFKSATSANACCTSR